MFFLKSSNFLIWINQIKKIRISKRTINFHLIKHGKWYFIFDVYRSIWMFQAKNGKNTFSIRFCTKIQTILGTLRGQTALLIWITNKLYVCFDCRLNTLQKCRSRSLERVHWRAVAFPKAAISDFYAELMLIQRMLLIDGTLMKNLLPATTQLKW